MPNDINLSTVTDPGTPPVGDPAETTPQGGTPQGGEGAPAGDGTTPPADWRTSLPDGWGDKLKDVESAEDALKALERGLGYTPAEKVEDITLKYPDSFKGQVDQGVEYNFRQFCVDNGITQDQAQKLLDWQLGANKEITDKIIADGVKELRSEWGSRFDENKATALKAFTALDKRMGGRLATSIEGRDMANNPVFVRAFHEIGKLLSEDVLSGGSGTAPSDARESAVDTYKGMFKE